MAHYITIARMNFSIHQTSHIGNRKLNQDRVAYAYNSDAVLLVLADGMGGHLHGEQAARLTVETFVESFGRYPDSFRADPQSFLTDTMRHANQRILRLPHTATLTGTPGSTCVAALIHDGKVYWGHAGDSRFYLFRDGATVVMTRDHSIVQEWIDSGMLTEEEARTSSQRNKITNCLGGNKGLFRMESGKPVELQKDDVLLLGSDGLWSPFTHNELAQIFISTPVGEALDSLVGQALERESGRSDNITGIALRWSDNNEVAHNIDKPVSCILETH